jgi:hypothetical protein
MGAQGTTTVSFGTTPTVDTATIAVTGQASILATSLAEAWIQGATAGTAGTANDEQSHLQAGALMKLVCGIPSAGVGFTIYCDPVCGMVTGDFKINWVWN